VMCIDAGVNSKQFVIRHSYLPEEQSFGISMNNRAGMMATATYDIRHTTFSRYENRSRSPFNTPITPFMDYLGDVLLCPHEWGKKKILGNMFRQPFREIWLSKIFMGSREMLANANRKMSPCNEYDERGNIMGSSHGASWDAFRSTGSRLGYLSRGRVRISGLQLAKPSCPKAGRS
jgi:MoaA/NifB/PqqE/SkfB family radical SAM enzyme